MKHLRFVRDKKTSVQLAVYDGTTASRIWNVSDETDQKVLFQLLRCMQRWPVVAYYASIDAHALINQKEILTMDLIKHLDPVDAKELVNAEKPSDRFFIIPSPGNMPEDDMLEYVDVRTAADLMSVINKAAKVSNKIVAVFDMADSSVVRLLQVVCEYSDVFGCEPTVITGITGADYSVKWEEAVINKPKISYIEIVDTVAEAKRVGDTLPKERTEHAKVKTAAKIGGRAPEFNKFNVNLFGGHRKTVESASDSDPGVADA